MKHLFANIMVGLHYLGRMALALTLNTRDRVARRFTPKPCKRKTNQHLAQLELQAALVCDEKGLTVAADIHRKNALSLMKEHKS